MNVWTALAAACWISRAVAERGRTGSRHAESAKLRHAARPRRAMAATSCARAAISAVGKVPSHMRDFLLGSRTSHTHFPALRRLTPLYTGCRVSRNLVRPARRLGGAEDTVA
ncbi:unnamed protein product [Spirodela intermedia]|uniref:Uncharacterized protein n=2 Tax=Spirodela intermedia TaxID=51605 RepID=A0A7I8JBL9_SPIIN|nr:unnamed protein product [Spirodela intermedia]CAA6666862.1 unnamed protein product [Spirodela intermedia]CAA7403668.1 unnamed protein product [Spirodela intermedia]